MKKQNTHIVLHAFELQVYLGYSEEERSQKQLITTEIDIQFISPPVACTTDRLEDTYCYNQLLHGLKYHLTQHSFQLIEKLGYEIYHFIKGFFPIATLVNIRITKKTAIADLKGGVSFYYGDT